MDRKAIAERISVFENRPRISIIVPVYNIDERWLRRCLDSVIAQLYDNWELCIADDCSTEVHIKPVLREYAEVDARIKVVFRPENGHISAASNSALDLATGEFVVLLDHDDELPIDALYWVVTEINDHPECDLIYSDEDKIDANGQRFGPTFKPDWSRDLFYSLNLVTHLSAFRTSIVKKIGGFRLGYEGSQDYDLSLRFIEQITDSRIRHIPRILYHWRAIKGSVALSGNEKPYAHERARKALRAHFERMRINATVTPAAFNLHRVDYSLHDDHPRVLLIVHGKDDRTGKDHADLLFEKTDYQNFEIVTVANAEIRKNGLGAALNTAAVSKPCDVLCFTDSGILPGSTDWLRLFVSFAVRPEIGAVGGKAIDGGGAVLHAGFVLGTNEVASNAHRGYLSDEPGNIFRNVVSSNFSAISASCMAVRNPLFREMNGFDEVGFSNCLFDVDLCLKLMAQGRRIVAVPDVKFMKTVGHPLSFERVPSRQEKTSFNNKWKSIIESDPFYNPNLSERDGRFSIKV